jgi:predicted lipid-binding transport protein (Tim44 family)
MHHLRSEIVATPDADARVRDDAVFELAQADAVDDVSGLLSVGYEGDAQAQAADAALVDGRFAADVLETAVRRAVDAWLEAVDGADEPLLGIAEPPAVDDLLYGGDGERTSRVVVRGARVLAVAITRCDVHTTPAELEVHIDVEGVRYREDRDTLAVLDGDKSRARRWQEAWTFTLSGDGEGGPWRLASAGLSPSAR